MSFIQRHSDLQKTLRDYRGSTLSCSLEFGSGTGTFVLELMEPNKRSLPIRVRWMGQIPGHLESAMLGILSAMSIDSTTSSTGKG